MTKTSHDIVKDLKTLILTRKGEKITDELAEERARNISVYVLDLLDQQRTKIYRFFAEHIDSVERDVEGGSDNV